MNRQCYSCCEENPDGQPFCGHCGSVLNLQTFIAFRVAEVVKDAVRDRDVLETESAIKVFEKAFGWFKILIGAAAVCLGILGYVGFKSGKDIRSSAEVAKQSVENTATEARNQIGIALATSSSQIQQASNTAQEAGRTASLLTSNLKATASTTKAELNREAASVRREVATSQSELASVKKLRPEVESIRVQLGDATTAIQQQQKVLASSEEFAKQIFSSHTAQIFSMTPDLQPKVLIVPPPRGTTGSTFVYVLLENTPIPGTAQVQWSVFAQLPNTFVTSHNLIIFNWGESVENLRTKPLSISYFRDTSDKSTYKSLTTHDGAVFVDGMQLPRMVAAP